MTEYKGIIKYIDKENASFAIIKQYPKIKDGTRVTVTSLAGPFDVSQSNLLNFAIGTYSIANVDVSQGAVDTISVTAEEIVSTINNTFELPFATVHGNAFDLQGEVGDDILLSGSACDIIFGSETIEKKSDDVEYCDYAEKYSYVKADFSGLKIGDIFFFKYRDNYDIEICPV